MNIYYASFDPEYPVGKRKIQIILASKFYDMYRYTIKWFIGV